MKKLGLTIEILFNTILIVALAMFLIGSAGTVLGVIVGMWAVSGTETLGSLYSAIAGMFTGTYTGGGINFNAIALHYRACLPFTCF